MFTQEKVSNVFYVLMFALMFIPVIWALIDLSNKKMWNYFIEQESRKQREIMQNFINTFDMFEKFLVKNISDDEFIPMVKKEGIITGDFVEIPYGSYYKWPIYSQYMLKRILLLSGKIAFDLGENYNKYLKVRFEEIDNYSEFSKRFMKLKSICSQDESIEIIDIESKKMCIETKL